MRRPQQALSSSRCATCGAPSNPCRDVLGLVELWALIRRRRPDIVHASSSKAGILGRLAAWLAGVPIRIFTVHGWAFAAYAGFPGRLYRVAERSMLPLTSATICVAEYERRVGIAAGACRADQTVVIPNAVQVSALPRVVPHGGLVELISVGRLRAPKDFVTLAQALARLERGSFRASLVGDGPDRSMIEAELEQLGLGDSVRLLGDRSDVPRLLAAADIFDLQQPLGGHARIDHRGDGGRPASRCVRRRRRARGDRRRTHRVARRTRWGGGTC